METYLLRHSQDGMWADHIMAFACSRVLQRPINIISSSGQEHDTMLGHGRVNSCINIGHLAEFHYVCLVPGNKIAANLKQ